MKKYLPLILITLLAGFLRFYNLNWGNGFYFHPDENNMARAITRLCLKIPVSKKQGAKSVRRESGLLRGVENLDESLSASNKGLPKFSPSEQLLFINNNQKQFSRASSKKPTERLDDCSLNPHFYAYGQFPLYLAYFSNYIYKSLQSYFLPSALNLEPRTALFSEAIFWLRLFSALASTLTIPLVYLITKMLTQKFQAPSIKSQINSKHQIPNYKRFGIWNFKNWSLFGNWDLGFGNLAAIFAAFTPGLIQAAHFGTTESLLTFFFMLILYLSLKMVKSQAPNSKSQINLKRQTPSTKQSVIPLGIAAGLALATKLTAIYFLAAPILAIALSKFQAPNSKSQINSKHQASNYKQFGIWNFKNWSLFDNWDLGFGILTYLLLTLLISIIFSPYNILDFGAFKSAILYETAIATGALPVFYTRQFIHTRAFLFQFTKIFPFSLGLPLFVLGTIGFIYTLLYKFQAPSIKSQINSKHQVSNHKQFGIWNFKNWSLFDNWDLGFGILVIAFLAYFIPNAMIFTKWTRFMTPALPLFAIFAALFISKFQAPNTLPRRQAGKSQINSKRQTPSTKQVVLNLGFRIWNLFGIWILRFGIFILILPGVLFFTIYTKPDTRIAASRWIYNNIPANSYILSETGNVVDIPVKTQKSKVKSQNCNNSPCVSTSAGKSYKIINFNFYNLDENPKLQQELLNHLVKADYIIIPSRRIFANLPARPPMRRADEAGHPLYPITYAYYNSLFSGRLGFKLIHTESPKSYPLPITHYPLPRSEETFSVFDHPTIRIFKKAVAYDKNYYREILILSRKL
jgi:hypothetical protein